jgi:hypothetical protein
MADAPKILGTDTLKNAYPKLNSAIDNANEALNKHAATDLKADTAITTANNAVTIATGADTKANSVRDEFDQVIAEAGSNNPEVVNARGTFPLLKNRLDDVTTSLAEMATDVSNLGANVNAMDNAPFIQAALDKGGLVTIKKPGNYVTSTLHIGDGTTLLLGAGVTLTLKSNTFNYLIVNKGEVATPKTRNKNISIQGGSYNFNGSNNAKQGAYRDGLFPGHGIFLRGVDGVNIADIEYVGQCAKFAFLLSDVTNVTTDNVNINNGSDGVHFHAPASNIKISNMTGYTGDNYLAFTIGDYNDYVTVENGDFNNVEIENVFIGSSTNPNAQPIQLVGSGLNGLGIFDNFTIKNVVAYMATGKEIVSLTLKDDSEGNVYLLNTKVRTIELSGLKRLNVDKAYPLITVTAAVSNLIIKDFVVDLNYTNTVLNALSSVIRNIKVGNFYFTGSNNAITSALFKFGAAGNVNLIKHISMDNISCSIDTTSPVTVIDNTNSNILRLDVSNSLFEFSTYKGLILYYRTTIAQSTVNIAKFSNCYLSNIANTIENNTTLALSNCNVPSLPSNILALLNNVGTIRVLIDSTDIPGGFRCASLTSPATMSYQGTSAYCNLDATALTPTDGDICKMRNTTTGEIALYIYTNSAWKKVTAA